LSFPPGFPRSLFCSTEEFQAATRVSGGRHSASETLALPTSKEYKTPPNFPVL
jgi:hypothetical protein